MIGFLRRTQILWCAFWHRNRFIPPNTNARKFAATGEIISLDRDAPAGEARSRQRTPYIPQDLPYDHVSNLQRPPGFQPPIRPYPRMRINLSWNPGYAWYTSWRSFLALLRWWVTGTDLDVTVVLHDANGQIIGARCTKSSQNFGDTTGTEASRDCTTGAGPGVDEWAGVDFTRLRADVHSVTFVLTSYFAHEIRDEVVDSRAYVSGQEYGQPVILGQLDLDRPRSNVHTAIILVQAVRTDTGWVIKTHGGTHCAKVWSNIDEELVAIAPQAPRPQTADRTET